LAAYALAHLRRKHDLHPDAIEYLGRIQSTLDPYAGRFLVHGGSFVVREGEWPGDPVVIEFPDLERARAWHASLAYQAILPLRTRHFDGDVILVEGVEPGYDPAKLADALRRGTMS
jgi:uncharacterized protein (DUF1330 family)